MKTKALFSAGLSWLLVSATPVLAAGPLPQDHSSIVVWAFLGFCALIVIAQLLPALLLLTGLVKGAVAPRETAEENVNE